MFLISLCPNTGLQSVHSIIVSFISYSAAWLYYPCYLCLSLVFCTPWHVLKLSASLVWPSLWRLGVTRVKALNSELTSHPTGPRLQYTHSCASYLGGKHDRLSHFIRSMSPNFKIERLKKQSLSFDKLHGVETNCSVKSININTRNIEVSYPFVYLLPTASAEAVLLLLWRHVVHPASRRPYGSLTDCPQVM